MTRDGLILIGLLAAGASTGELVELTHLPERTCRRGLRRLVRTNDVWSPQRGRWSLTCRGCGIAAELPTGIAVRP
jgi:DNA-binding IclR family transcriptional regulator